ncbi:IS4 family transposase [Granulosicoccus antarcticus]|uniref:Transposase for transposon Tn5 n=1 Tax=Granulosicoccus antarcticus IMCC3135 TaxID=1192854 RepID=A0A2Z2NTH3_9GAMM|nr:IS4 family transposase [Granulosicoccus antarcticus]ASJ74619.1 Transposase for transposon Tn5 [Granulosicoccus antarcticus IMCC3135]
MGWASEELGGIDLGDARLNKRAALLAERLAESPADSIPHACQGWAEIQAAYRLFNHECVDFWSIMNPHIQCTMQRMSANPVVLCLQDTTTLDFQGQDIDGLGPLQFESQKGMLLHPTYVVTPGREPLGLIDSWNWAREPKQKNGKRPETINESERWVEGYERICESAAQLPDTRCIYVGDRESDMLALMRRAVALDHPADWLVRARHDRALPDGRKLFASVAEQKPSGTVNFRFRPRRGVKERDVVQHVYVQRVTISDKNGDAVEASCVIAREQNPPEGMKPVEWRLLSNRAVEDLDQAAELINWYRARWEIEMYFDILKNGCKVESLQLKRLASLEVALAIFMIVAWRINRLMRLGRQCPGMEASLVFEADEIRAAYAMNRKKVPKDTVPTINEVVRLVAMAGGFIGRKSDGEPGAKTLWRGLEKIMSFADGLRYARANPETG